MLSPNFNAFLGLAYSFTVNLTLFSKSSMQSQPNTLIPLQTYSKSARSPFSVLRFLGRPVLIGTVNYCLKSIRMAWESKLYILRSSGFCSNISCYHDLR